MLTASKQAASQCNACAQFCCWEVSRHLLVRSELTPLAPGNLAAAFAGLVLAMAAVINDDDHDDHDHGDDGGGDDGDDDDDNDNGGGGDDNDDNDDDGGGGGGGDDDGHFGVGGVFRCKPRCWS